MLSLSTRSCDGHINRITQCQNERLLVWVYGSARGRGRCSTAQIRSRIRSRIRVRHTDTRNRDRPEIAAALIVKVDTVDNLIGTGQNLKSKTRPPDPRNTLGHDRNWLHAPIVDSVVTKVLKEDGNTAGKAGHDRQCTNHQHGQLVRTRQRAASDDCDIVDLSRHAHHRGASRAEKLSGMTPIQP